MHALFYKVFIAVFLIRAATKVETNSEIVNVVVLSLANLPDHEARMLLVHVLSNLGWL
jgi:hypothetical protein